jgi:hypothetical protein
MSDKQEKTVLEETMSLADASQLCYLDDLNMRLSRTGDRFDLVLCDGRRFENVNVRKAFPLSHPNNYFSFRDAKKKEIGVLCDMDRIDKNSRELLQSALERGYLIAIIKRIVKVNERFGTVDWEVETDRGPCKFTTRDLRENAVRTGVNQYLMIDVEENRFEIEDITKLDAASQAWLDRYL